MEAVAPDPEDGVAADDDHDDDECTICMIAPPALTSPLRTTQCGHLFCEQCLRAHAATKPSNQEVPCPLCRADITAELPAGTVRPNPRPLPRSPQSPQSQDPLTGGGRILNEYRCLVCCCVCSITAQVWQRLLRTPAWSCRLVVVVTWMCAIAWMLAAAVRDLFSEDVTVSRTFGLQAFVNLTALPEGYSIPDNFWVSHVALFWYNGENVLTAAASFGQLAVVPCWLLVALLLTKARRRMQLEEPRAWRHMQMHSDLADRRFSPFICCCCLASDMLQALLPRNGVFRACRLLPQPAPHPPAPAAHSPAAHSPITV